MAHWPPTPDEAERLRPRFFARVGAKDASGCMPWTGYFTKGGYGCIQIGMRPFLAHRLALHYAGIDLPVDMFALHSCDNKPCVNPAHLRAGTKRDNARDAVERKRYRRDGKHNGRARLTEEQVVSVRAMVAGGRSQEDVAFVFNVAQTTGQRHRSPPELGASVNGRAIVHALLFSLGVWSVLYLVTKWLVR